MKIFLIFKYKTYSELLLFHDNQENMLSKANRVAAKTATLKKILSEHVRHAQREDLQPTGMHASEPVSPCLNIFH